MAVQDTLARLIHDVPDFPKPGIVFKDITPVLADGDALREVVDALAEPWQRAGVTCILGIESRGFIFGAAVAYSLGIGLELVRKPGKLPRRTNGITYDLEYGTDHLEIHADALTADSRVAIIDDVLATGGTAEAVGKLVERSGATLCGYGFVLELDFLGGRKRLGESMVHTLAHIG
ncbi:MAG: adenine phosphoribosyltransferase [Deltaproteobacteria bacterium]|nr:adenine phosphoribosyltransferase [Deltaproteobacteria bacterium]MCB9786537.1 adenine phosphoribosyltransferase [Deltaproteobacteria bacterium]